MQFELATVLSCEPGGCQVLPVSGGPAFAARYSALVRDRVRILPGQLVAVDLQPAVPEVAWRWYRVRLVGPEESGPKEGREEREVIVQERERQLSAVRVPGLETSGSVGDDVWVTGMEGVWELHDSVVEEQHDRVVVGRPSDPTRLRERVLPRIAGLLSGQKGGKE